MACAMVPLSSSFSLSGRRRSMILVPVVSSESNTAFSALYRSAGSSSPSVSGQQSVTGCEQPKAQLNEEKIIDELRQSDEKRLGLGALQTVPRPKQCCASKAFTSVPIGSAQPVASRPSGPTIGMIAFLPAFLPPAFSSEFMGVIARPWRARKLANRPPPEEARVAMIQSSDRCATAWWKPKLKMLS